MQTRKRFSVPALLAVVLLPAAAWAQTPVKGDVQTDVKEMPTGCLMFGVCVNSDAGLTGSIVLNERNFAILPSLPAVDDLLKSGRVNIFGNCSISLQYSSQHPIDPEDWMNERTFRSAGQEVRIEAVPGDVQETPTGCLMFGVAVNSDAGLTGS